MYKIEGFSVMMDKSVLVRSWDVYLTNNQDIIMLDMILDQLINGAKGTRTS